MKKIDINQLYTIASQFRKAIEIAKNNELSSDSYFGRFPSGCCGYASDLLGYHLIQLGIKSEYICGMYYHNVPEGNFQSHAWIEVDEIIIDITGDQFKNEELFLCYDKPVYVGRMDEFHKLFEKVIIRDSENFCEDDDYERASKLENIYEVIIKYVH